MAEMWFDPNAIRGDIEKTLTQAFNPSVYKATTNYVKDALVSLGGFVYSASASTIGVAPPANPWVKESRVLKLIYENVDATLATAGSLRIVISWLGTSNESVGCDIGSLRSIEGTLTCWVLSPKSSGTSVGLVDAARLRRLFNSWKGVSDCGKQIRMYAANGPRSASVPSDSDFYSHVVTCSLVAMERVQTLR
jgi:hypothetical protein